MTKIRRGKCPWRALSCLLSAGAAVGALAQTGVHAITALGISSNAAYLTVDNLRSSESYRVESTEDLLSAQWSQAGAFRAMGLSTNWIGPVSPGDAHQAYRVRVSAPLAMNLSYATNCAEHDNVNIPLLGRVRTFLIEATHATNPLASADCAARTNDCPPAEPGYAFTPGTYPLYDDHTTVVHAVREPEWWRTNGMSVSVNADPPATNVHYLRLIRKIQDAASWPEFLVLYVDGNLRLKPHPPSGMTDTCFGTSVIVGPANIAFRPFTDIASIRYVSASNLLEVSYAGGGTAAIQVLTVSRSQALVRVTAKYPMDEPFATFRSMFLQDGIADADHVRWRTVAGDFVETSVSAFPGGEGTEWYLFKATPSTVRPSAPNIRIAVENP